MRVLTLLLVLEKRAILRPLVVIGFEGIVVNFLIVVGVFTMMVVEVVEEVMVGLFFLHSDGTETRLM